MIRVKRLLLVLLALIMSINLIGCGDFTPNEDGGKITIMTTLFPQYDFAKHIVGDKCEVILLLPPGSDSHSYEPTPKDIININNAELFVYTGDDMEAWVATILDGVDNKNLNVLDLSENIELLNAGESEHAHTHEHEHEHEHEEEEENHNIFGHTHSHDIDPHYFTSPKNAMIMLQDIYEEIIAMDPDNKEYYTANYEAYLAELIEVDEELHEVVHEADYNTLYFGGKFALLYFIEEYHLDYVSPFDSCAHEAEASPKSIVEIIECMEEHSAHTVFYEELTDPKVANIISEEIGGQALLLHSCHNVSKEEFESGVSYVDLMRQNADNLREGLYK